MKLARIFIIMLLLVGFGRTEEARLSSGRFLPGGIWQPRNMHATLPEPASGMAAQQGAPDSREEIQSISWGPDVMLAGPDLFAFYSCVAEGPNHYIHVISDQWPSSEPVYFRSTDGGEIWDNPRMIAESTGVSVVFPILLAESNYVTLLTDGLSVVSTNYGDSWLHWVYIYTGGQGLPNAAVLGNRIYSAPTAADHRAMCHYSDDYGQTWQYHSQSTLRFYDAVAALGATNMGLHMLIDWATTEIFYKRYLFSNPGWNPSIMLSGDTTHSSFLPKIIAWGDSNVFAIWVDYEYSPYPWTGDLICRRSTNNGESWLPEQQVTFNHLALNKSIYLSGDSIFLVYDEIVLDGRTNTEEIFFNLSSDGGATWGQPLRLTYSDWRSINPYIAVADNRIHISFCDARDDTVNGMHNSVYYKRGIISNVGISWDIEKNLPENLSLGAYPNPFNDQIMITLKGVKGGDIRITIYDIRGREIRTFKGVSMGGEKKIVWDATDASGKKVSSGLYFARAFSSRSSQTIKLIVLR
jgi:hypothetical protein